MNKISNIKPALFKFGFTAIVFFLWACTSTLKQDRFISLSQTDSNLDKPVFLSDLKQNGFDLIAEIHSKRSKPSEAEFNYFEQTYLNKDLRKNLRSKPESQKKKIVFSNKSSDFKSLMMASADSTLEGTLKLVKKMDLENTKAIINTLDLSHCATPAQFSLAMALHAEQFFPDTELHDSSLSLLENAYTCGSSAVKETSAYRLSLFLLANKNCDQAIQYFNFLKDGSNSKLYQARAYYWSAQCEKAPVVAQNVDKDKAEIAPSNSLAFFRRFPNSYHMIRFFENSSEDLKGLVAGQKINPVAYNGKLPELNLFIYKIEEAFLNHDNNAAARLLQSLRQNDNLLNEPHVLVYLAFFADQVEDNLSTFNLLAKAFSLNYELKNLDTLSLFYPIKYFDLIKKASEKYNLDPYLMISLVRQESAFNAGSMSRVGARGLMQIMPRTGRLLKKGLQKNQLFQAEVNIELGVKYFAELVKKYNGSVYLALAAYNAGHGNVDAWLKRYPSENPELFVDLIPFRETREYVSSILRNNFWYKALYEVPSVKAAKN